jgi:hypothetical protein
LSFQVVVGHTALVLNVSRRMIWLEDVGLEILPDNVEHGNPVEE